MKTKNEYTFPKQENFENKKTSSVCRLVVSIGRLSAASRVRDNQVQFYTYKHIYDTYVTSDEQLKLLLVVG